MLRILPMKFLRSKAAAEHRMFLDAVFAAMFRRAPLEHEYAYFLPLLMEGVAPSDVVQRLMRSPEHDLRAKPFVAPGHYYSPIVAPETVAEHLAAVRDRSLGAALPGITLDLEAMQALWGQLAPAMLQAPFRAEKQPGLRYYFDNGAYSWGDGLLLNAMLVHFRPRRIIEVGCGHSSACIRDTMDLVPDWKPNLTSIDPYPDTLRSLLEPGDEGRFTAIDRPVQSVPLETFDRLRQDDMLIIDSTHVLKTGSDVCFELFEVLPRLRPGVLVHIHDMFFPFEYPESWVVDEGRSWNELYAVRAFLQFNPSFEIVFFNDFMRTVAHDAIAATVPNFLVDPGSAMWLRKTA